jgi:hypothetical protein
MRTTEPLPPAIRLLFWDYDVRRLRWDRDRDLVIGRVLAAGPWETVVWLQERIGREGIRDWLLSRRGRGLSPQQLRYWQLVLDLPKKQVDAWLGDPSRQVWDRRTG